MQRTTRRIILALLISFLPSLGIAAETAPATTPLKPAAPVAASQPAAPLAAPVKPGQPATPSPGTVSATPPVTAAPVVNVTPKAVEVLKPERLRLGYVDFARVSTESRLGKSSAAQAKQRQEKFQAQIIAKRKQLEKQKAAIEAQIAKLPPAEREAKAREKSREFQKKVESFQKFGMNADKEMQALQEKLGRSFNESIGQAATEYGSKNGLALVVIKQQMLYLSGKVDAQDVTDAVIKLMDEKQTKQTKK